MFAYFLSTATLSRCKSSKISTSLDLLDELLHVSNSLFLTPGDRVLTVALWITGVLMLDEDM